jgi:hypothetical protein
MSLFNSPLIQTLVNVPLLSRLRRNHGLEHASLHVLTHKYPNTKLAGHSDGRGFWLLGDVSIEDVRDAVDEALRRMRSGEGSLAIHQNCGTNFVTAGMLAGLAAGLSMLGVGQRTRDKVERLPLAMSLATLALIFAQPLGFLVQEQLTTCGEPGNLQVTEIIATRRSRINAFRIMTRG